MRVEKATRPRATRITAMRCQWNRRRLRCTTEERHECSLVCLREHEALSVDSIRAIFHRSGLVESSSHFFPSQLQWWTYSNSEHFTRSFAFTMACRRRGRLLPKKANVHQRTVCVCLRCACVNGGARQPTSRSPLIENNTPERSRDQAQVFWATFNDLISCCVSNENAWLLPLPSHSHSHTRTRTHTHTSSLMCAQYSVECVMPWRWRSVTSADRTM